MNENLQQLGINWINQCFDVDDHEETRDRVFYNFIRAVLSENYQLQDNEIIDLINLSNKQDVWSENQKNQFTFFWYTKYEIIKSYLNWLNS